MAEAPGFLTARWVHLAMLNYEVDPAILARRVPAGTELDQFEGRTFVSMVGFQFLETRVLGVPIPFHRDFDEVNLRFYVRRRVGDELRRGVVFVREIVPRRAIALLARLLYNEPYVALPMRHRDEVSDPESPYVAYQWRSGDRWNGLRVEIDGAPRLFDEGTEESFITEHYWGYCRQRDGSTIEYQVEHPRWKVWSAVGSDFDCDVATLYGEEFVAPLTGPPSSVFLADGSEVIVRKGRRLD